VPNCATPDYFAARAMETMQLLRYLQDFGPDRYFGSGAAPPENERCTQLIETAWKAYCDKYMGEWNTAYGARSVTALERVKTFDRGWEAFATQYQTGAAAPPYDARKAVRDEVQQALAQALHAVRWPLSAPDGKTLAELTDAYYATQLQRVTALFEASRQALWQQGSFAGQAALPGAATVNVTPWDQLATSVTDAWVKWCDTVGAAVGMPRRFEADTTLTPRVPVPWDALAKLQTDAGMRGERLTADLIAYQLRAQQLLNAELTSILVDIQKARLGDAARTDGWPYVVLKDAAAAGAAVNALAAVDFPAFVSCVREVQRAAEFFAPLEQGLPATDTTVKARQAFVKGCKDWLTFLALDAQGQAAPLSVKVWTEDPLDSTKPAGTRPVDDTAQYYYETARLELGLKLEGATTALEFNTGVEGRNKETTAIWEWERGRGQTQLQFTLVTGLPSKRGDQTSPPFPAIDPLPLGEWSPLSLCAYWQRYGKFGDGNWYVSHGISLAERFKAMNRAELVNPELERKPVIGAKFVFRPGRALPAPIAPLQPAAPVAPPAGGSTSH
jgi:hypothetical protein